MPLASTLNPEGLFKGLFVGPSKQGKTCAACSFPGVVRVLDFDGRIRGVLGAPWLKDKLPSIEYEYYPPRTPSNQKPTYEKINNDLEFLLNDITSGKSKIRTVVLDSLTSETFAMLSDAVPLTHAEGKGKKLGVLNMAGPEDYGFEATATYNLLSFLRSLPVNLICTAHIVDRYGRADEGDKYSEKIVIGEKLSIRDKIGENVGIYFDHCFRFDKDMVAGKERYSVQFRSDIAATAFEKLPHGRIDITGKDFYTYLMEAAKITPPFYTGVGAK